MLGDKLKFNLRQEETQNKTNSVQKMDFENKFLPFVSREKSAWEYAESIVSLNNYSKSSSAISKLIESANSLLPGQKKYFYACALFIAKSMDSQLYNDTLDNLSNRGVDLNPILNILEQKNKISKDVEPQPDSSFENTNPDAKRGEPIEQSESINVESGAGSFENVITRRHSPNLIERISSISAFSFTPGIANLPDMLNTSFASFGIANAYMSKYNLSPDQYLSTLKSSFGTLINAYHSAGGDVYYGASSGYDYKSICSDILKFLDSDPKAGLLFLSTYFKDAQKAREALEKGTAEGVIEFINLRNIDGQYPCPINGYFDPANFPTSARTHHSDVKIGEIPITFLLKDIDAMIKGSLRSGGPAFIPTAITTKTSIFERTNTSETVSIAEDGSFNITPLFTTKKNWNQYDAGLISYMYIPALGRFSPGWLKTNAIYSDRPDGAKLGWEVGVSKRSPELGITAMPLNVFTNDAISIDYNLLVRQIDGDNIVSKTDVKLESAEISVPCIFVDIPLAVDVGYSGRYEKDASPQHMVFFTLKTLLGEQGYLSTMFGVDLASGGTTTQIDVTLPIWGGIELVGGYQVVNGLRDIYNQPGMFKIGAKIPL